MDNTAKTEHTPLPWRVDGEGKRALIRGADFTIVANRHMLPAEVHQANFALIADAVNSHSDLVAALGAIRLRTTPHIDDDLKELQRQMHHIAALADAAIAKVSP